MSELDYEVCKFCGMWPHDSDCEEKVRQLRAFNMSDPRAAGPAGEGASDTILAKAERAYRAVIAVPGMLGPEVCALVESHYELATALRALHAACSCACCAEAAERRRTDRDVAGSCNCRDYGTAEWCDCPFCLLSRALPAGAGGGDELYALHMALLNTERVLREQAEWIRGQLARAFPGAGPAATSFSKFPPERCPETALMDGTGRCALPSGHPGRHVLKGEVP